MVGPASSGAPASTASEVGARGPVRPAPPVVAAAGPDARLAPAQPAPAQQVATAVVDALPAAGPPPAQPAATPVAAVPPAVSVPKILQIRLEPAELGSVAVELRLAGGTLELHVEAARGETARLLDRDRDRLAKALHASGYQLDKVTIRTAEPDRTPTPGEEGAQPQGQDQSGASRSGAQPQSGWSPGDDAPSRKGADAGGRDDEVAKPRHGDGDEPADQSRRSGDLYV
jgi:flagellar hook-length control protein FliK